eukprot:scaffold1894_cov162-Ochromonas_danica.AAC.3
MKDTMKMVILSDSSSDENNPLPTSPTASTTTSTTTSSSLLPTDVHVNPSSSSSNEEDSFFSSQALKDAIYEWQEHNLQFFLSPNDNPNENHKNHHLYEEDAELITHAMHPATVQDEQGHGRDDMILWRIGEPCDHTDKRFLSTAKTINGCWAAISSRYNDKMKLMKFHVSKEVKRLDLTKFTTSTTTTSTSTTTSSTSTSSSGSSSHDEHREEKEVVLQSHLIIRYLKTVSLDYDDRIEVEFKQRHHTFLEYQEYQVTASSLT